jgi:uncharacterized protein (TIGR03084 family)
VPSRRSAALSGRGGSDVAVSLADLTADLKAESKALLALLDPLVEAEWDLPTPAQGWSIRDQVSHLAFFDERTNLAISDPDGFRLVRPDTMEGIQALVDRVAQDSRSRTGDDLRTWLEQERATLLASVAERSGSDRVPWYGPDMSISSMVTARIMESWAHGRDIADALGIAPTPTDRLRHVIFLGLQAAPNSFRSRGLAVPTTPIRIEAVAPDGSTWSFGPAAATDTVTGSALDLALVVTQRRHVTDTDVRATGDTAQAWLGVAQAFAGPPTPGRPPMKSEAVRG